MYVVTVVFRIEKDRAHEFNALVRSNAAMSLAMETGCHRFDVCASSDDPEGVFLYELYEDRAAFDAHLHTQHFQSFDAKIADIVISKDVKTYDEVWT